MFVPQANQNRPWTFIKNQHSITGESLNESSYSTTISLQSKKMCIGNSNKFCENSVAFLKRAVDWGTISPARADIITIDFYISLSAANSVSASSEHFSPSAVHITQRLVHDSIHHAFNLRISLSWHFELSSKAFLKGIH